MAKILIVEDDADTRELLKVRLHTWGYETAFAFDAVSAISVTRELRRAEATSGMPIILLTARAQESDVARGLAAGADEYVKKPFDARDLREPVARLLSRGLAKPA